MGYGQPREAEKTSAEVEVAVAVAVAFRCKHTADRETRTKVFALCLCSFLCKCIFLFAAFTGLSSSIFFPSTFSFLDKLALVCQKVTLFFLQSVEKEKIIGG